MHCSSHDTLHAGPLSRDLLTSGLDSLVPQSSLPRPKLADLKTAVSLSSQDTMQSPMPGTARHSRNNVSDSSFISLLRARLTRCSADTLLSGQRKDNKGLCSDALFCLQSLLEGANSFLAGPDPLAALTENLNQHITAEAFKPRPPAPWELQATATIPEEPGYGHADSDAPESAVSRRESRDFGYAAAGARHPVPLSATSFQPQSRRLCDVSLRPRGVQTAYSTSTSAVLRCMRSARRCPTSSRFRPEKRCATAARHPRKHPTCTSVTIWQTQECRCRSTSRLRSTAGCTA